MIRERTCRWSAGVLALVATSIFAVIAGRAVLGEAPSPSWHSRVLLPVVVLAATAGAATTRLSPSVRWKRAAVAAVTSVSLSAAALYAVIGLHREQGCMERGVPDPVEQQVAATGAHRTGEQLIGWTDFEMRLLVGEMTCQQTDGFGTVSVAYRVDVLDLVYGSQL